MSMTRRVIVAELSREIGPPMFWGVLTLPDGMTGDDIPRLYYQWRKLQDLENTELDFPDWLIRTMGFGEETAGFCWLDPSRAE
jgi:hypothetical protein